MPLAAPVAAAGDQLGSFQHGEMLGDRLPRHREPLAQFGQRHPAMRAQLVEQRAAGGVGQGHEGVGHCARLFAPLRVAR